MANNFVTAAATSFNDAAAYDTYRPGYAVSAVNDLLEHLGLFGKTHAKVIDLAAGSGKLTQELASRDEQFEIVAVEPVEAMRNTLAAKNLNNVQVREGLATDIGLPDEWADGLIVAQAFHWFANEEALAEIQRVLKPGAKIGLIWNIENYNQPPAWKATTAWEGTLNQQILDLPRFGPDRFRDDKWRQVYDRQATTQCPMFATPIGTAQQPFKLWLKPDAIWSRVNTLSQLAILEGTAREEFIAKFNKLMSDGDCERNDKGEVAVHGCVYYAWTSRL